MSSAHQINAQNLQPKFSDEQIYIRKRWFSAFVMYYSFIFLCFITEAFFKIPSLYQIALWITPFIHYFAYKKSNIYWFAFYTSIAPVAFLYTFMELKRFTQGDVLTPFIICIQITLFIILVGMSFKLLKVLSDNDQIIYGRGVSYLWVLALVGYNGLFLVQQIKNYLATFSIIRSENIVDISAMITAKAILFGISYYFVIKRKNIIVLLLILLIVPMPFLGSAIPISSKIYWLSFFFYLCISTYRLYRVNSTEKSSVKNIPAEI